ncbi:hypothetical protein HPB50_022517 [Hyalomma asiaticum]|uniref:Uncharacterized protein n=1 Tax=Hyalomma asiaticum TaxID=266040 RepID=A0ACB7S1H7_HYAAI|nr:hypothetical protein HPB50_022517 [Hyalomma asiaticum]
MVARLRFETLVFAFTALTSRSIILAEDELALLASFTPCELVRYYGYPCELSYATTDDGYVLEVERIRHGREPCASPGRAQKGRRRRHPVLFLPSFLAASDMWFLNYPWQSPGKLRVCFVVVSFDEIGRHDLAAVIDHVLKASGASKVTLLSLSQGVAIALVLLSTRPEYNDKFRFFLCSVTDADDDKAKYFDEE